MRNEIPLLCVPRILIKIRITGTQFFNSCFTCSFLGICGLTESDTSQIIPTPAVLELALESRRLEPFHNVSSHLKSLVFKGQETEYESEKPQGSFLVSGDSRIPLFWLGYRLSPSKRPPAKECTGAWKDGW